MLILEIQTLLFIFARITSFIVVVPGFSHKSLPNTLKVFLGAVLSFLVYTTIDVTPVYPEIVLFTLAMFRETLIGLAMGFSVKLVFLSSVTTNKDCEVNLQTYEFLNSSAFWTCCLAQISAMFFFRKFSMVQIYK